MDLESEIDRLYQLPLSEFTAARNALAKDLVGDARRRIQQLAKPSAPAWAVNQIYWHARPTYEALMDAAEKLRAAHRDAISGRAADVRRTDQLHRTTVQNAMAAALKSLERAGLQPTPATKQAVSQTLAAISKADPAGRLAAIIQPKGFDVFAGVTPRPLAERPAPKPPKKVERGPSRPSQEQQLKRELRAAAQQSRHADAALQAAKAKLGSSQTAEQRSRDALARASESRLEAEREVAECQTAAAEAATKLKDAERKLQMEE